MSDLLLVHLQQPRHLLHNVRRGVPLVLRRRAPRSTVLLPRADPCGSVVEEHLFVRVYIPCCDVVDPYVVGVLGEVDFWMRALVWESLGGDYGSLEGVLGILLMQNL